MDPQQALSALARLREAAQASHHRRLAVLAGERGWAADLACRYLDLSRPAQALWIGDQTQAACEVEPYQRAAGRLGSELQLLVYDAWAGFDPDAFGAAQGTVPGGGMILLLTPPLETWPEHADPAARRIAMAGHDAAIRPHRLLRRLRWCLQHMPGIWIARPDAWPPTVESSPPDPPSPPRDSACLTRDQAHAVEAVAAAGQAPRQATVVMTADRGRGKSAALGIAAGRLLASGMERIVVTAPRSASVRPVFELAATQCPGAAASPFHLRTTQGEIEYTAPDSLIASPPRADLLLVDEAAGIPAPLLTALLQRFPRVVFASTIHGYEGTGQGFAIRFRRTLDQQRPDWRHITLQTPVRWAPDDPVEAFTTRALLLDAEPATLDAKPTAIVANCRYACLDRDALAADEARLSQVFGLLVNAHYRTTPTDLRNLLDGPTVRIHTLCTDNVVAAAAVTVDEGRFDEPLSDAVWLGVKRPHGHMLPQSLSFHGGHRQAAQLMVRRVMRIAVHPRLRRKGLGSALLTQIAEGAAADGTDMLGTSFGATRTLLAFWQRAGLRMARLGLRRDAASGAHAAMLIRGLTPLGRTQSAQIEAAAAADLEVLLQGPLRDLEAGLVDALPARSGAPPAPSQHDYLQAYGFARSHRPFEAALPPLQRIARELGLSGTPPQARALLEACLLEHRTLKDAARALQLPSQKTALARLREGVEALLQQAQNDDAAAAEQRYEAIRASAQRIAGPKTYVRDAQGRLTARHDAGEATAPACADAAARPRPAPGAR